MPQPMVMKIAASVLVRMACASGVTCAADDTVAAGYNPSRFFHLQSAIASDDTSGTEMVTLHPKIFRSRIPSPEPVRSGQHPARLLPAAVGLRGRFAHGESECSFPLTRRQRAGQTV